MSDRQSVHTDNRAPPVEINVIFNINLATKMHINIALEFYIFPDPNASLRIDAHFTVPPHEKQPRLQVAIAHAEKHKAYPGQQIVKRKKLPQRFLLGGLKTHGSTSRCNTTRTREAPRIDIAKPV